VKIDSDNAVRGLFLVDGRTREIYKTFMDCIFFDTTFYVNRYNIPFVPIVGVNNHMQSILLGCTLLLDKMTESFCLDIPNLERSNGWARTKEYNDQPR
jgi:hypothetical protein